jgi:hypothetical protein
VAVAEGTVVDVTVSPFVALGIGVLVDVSLGVRDGQRVWVGMGVLLCTRVAVNVPA